MSNCSDISASIFVPEVIPSPRQQPQGGTSWHASARPAVLKVKRLAGGIDRAGESMAGFVVGCE